MTGTSILHPELEGRLRFLLYRSRFLVVYVILGVLSLALEIVLFRGLERIGLARMPAWMVGFVAGILFAFWTNVRFNFKVPAAKRNRALLYFVAISAGSALVHFLLHRRLQAAGWSYERARFVVSGSIFFFAYLLHRRFSFADYKRVGVAIYANGIEDIRGIYEKIRAVPDFIHVDIIDDTFGELQHDPRAYRLEVIRAYWPRKPVHVHIMSRRPGRWVEDVAPFARVIYVHVECEEPIAPLLDAIRARGCRAGLCVMMGTPVESVRPFAANIDALMLLTIPVPGRSGQSFDMAALDRIETVNRWPERGRFTLCVDGGVNERVVRLVQVEEVVSGHAVLSHADPVRQIMRLQTSMNYEGV